MRVDKPEKVNEAKITKKNNMSSTAGKVLGGKCRVVAAAATKGGSSGSKSNTNISLLKWKPKSTVPKSKVKGSASALASASPTPTSSSQLGKFLGIPQASPSDFSTLLSKFIKLNNSKNPGMKMDIHCEEKLKALLTGQDRVGIPEIVKLVNQQFGKTG